MMYGGLQELRSLLGALLQLYDGPEYSGTQGGSKLLTSPQMAKDQEEMSVPWLALLPVA